MRQKRMALAVFLLVVFWGVACAHAAALAPWSTVGQLPSGNNSVSVKFALVDTNGNLVKGLKGAAFTLFDIGAGTSKPGEFIVTVVENASLRGTYTMTIKPDGTTWSSKFYVFKFLTKYGTGYGVGQVTVANVKALWPSAAALTQEEKEQFLNAIPLE